MMELSIIIPIFNEEKTIDIILNKINKLRIPGISKELIIVDDGSSDGSINLINHFLSVNKRSNTKLLRHKNNLGKGAAVITGIKSADGDYILIQDADLEYDPMYITGLISPVVNKTAQVVYGTRLKRWPHIFSEEKNPRFLLHYFGNRILSLITGILYGQFLTDMETGYKLFPRNLAQKLNLCSRSFNFEPEITAKILKRGYKITEVPIVTQPRGYAEGKKLNTVRDGILALWTLLKYRIMN